MGILRQHNEQMIKTKAVFPRLDKVLTDRPQKVLEGEVVHSETIEDNFLELKVYLICHYTAERLTNLNSFGASSFYGLCYVRDGLSIMAEGHSRARLLLGRT